MFYGTCVEDACFETICLGEVFAWVVGRYWDPRGRDRSVDDVAISVSC